MNNKKSFYLMIFAIVIVMLIGLSANHLSVNWDITTLHSRTTPPQENHGIKSRGFFFYFTKLV